MPESPGMLQRLADPRQASVFDSTMQQLMRRLAQALQSGELKHVAMGATQPVKGGASDLARRIQPGTMPGAAGIAGNLDRFGYGDLTDGLADTLLSGRRSQITMPGMQRMVRGMGYDDVTNQVAGEAANNPDYLQGLLDFVLWRHGPGR